ncbi:MAG: hypothetical protein KGS61_19375, partial [Verrucomicrobia bacterium]|nr:hypothetical protein [Verrucomicrobiota bacterium]
MLNDGACGLRRASLEIACERLSRSFKACAWRAVKDGLVSAPNVFDHRGQDSYIIPSRTLRE